MSASLMKNMMRGMAVIFLPITAFMPAVSQQQPTPTPTTHALTPPPTFAPSFAVLEPQAMQLYFATTSLTMLAQTFSTQWGPTRRLLNIPDEVTPVVRHALARLSPSSTDQRHILTHSLALRRPRILSFQRPRSASFLA